MKTLLLVHKDSEWKTLPSRVKKLETHLKERISRLYGGDFTIDYKVIDDVPTTLNGNIKLEWFRKMHDKYEGYTSYGYLFPPTVGNKIGVDKNTNGIYYRDTDKVFDFWIKTTESKTERMNRHNPKDRRRMKLFELVMEHELAGHGVSHFMGLPFANGDSFTENSDNTHYFFYRNQREEYYTYIYGLWHKISDNFQKRLNFAQILINLFKKKKNVKDISTDYKFYFIDKKFKVTQPYLNQNSIYSSGYHIGTDYNTPIHTPVVAPVDGELRNVRRGYFGGLTCSFAFTSQNKPYTFRFLHLDRAMKEGTYKAGQVIAFTGNSGAMTTGAHLHVDCWKGDVQIEKIKDKASIEKYTVDPDKMIKSMVA